MVKIAYKTEYDFLLPLFETGRNKIQTAIFLDEDYNLVKAPNIEDAHKIKGERKSAYFDDDGKLEGRHRPMFMDYKDLVDGVTKEPLVVMDFDNKKLFVVHKAPKKGYYIRVELAIYVEEKEENKIESRNFDITLGEEEQGESNFEVVPKVLDGQKLNEPEHRPLERDELFEIMDELLKEEWESILHDYAQMYYSTKPFLYNEEKLGGKING